MSCNLLVGFPESIWLTAIQIWNIMFIVKMSWVGKGRIEGGNMTQFKSSWLSIRYCVTLSREH